MMIRQKSFENKKPTLFLVATPIGNLSEMTYRAVETLKSVQFIAAEDTRNTIKLLNHFNITTKLISHHEHNIVTSIPKIIQLLQDGYDIALVSDAGYPAISDPGYELVKEVISNGYNVVPISGANACLNALVVSGITPQPFLFYGFLDHQDKKKKKELEDLKNNGHLEDHLYDVDYVLDNLDAVDLKPSAQKYYTNGGVIDSRRFNIKESKNSDAENYLVRVYCENIFIGVGKILKDNNTMTLKSDKLLYSK